MLQIIYKRSVMKGLIIVAPSFCIADNSFAQNKEAGTDRQAIKDYMMKRDTTPSFKSSKNEAAVKAVLKKYNSAIEGLNVVGTDKLFSADSKIYESGSSEGTYAHYLEHHLTPELKEFKSFTFSDYKADVQVEGAYAFAVETYNYTMVLAKDNSEVKRKGAATSILKKIKGDWLIMVSHNSSRK